MKNKYGKLIFIQVITFTCLSFLSTTSFAGGTEGKWGIGIKGGGAFLTQDIIDPFEGTLGPVIVGSIVYGRSNSMSVGLNLERETHSVEVLGVSIGDFNTISLLPFVQFRGFVSEVLRPYGLIGFGFNINSFDENTLLQQICITLYGNTCEFDPETTIAIKFGGGVDFFITPS